MIYEIFEGNMERLEKKLNLIQSKCQKYGCEFNASIVGEVFKEIKDQETGRVSTIRYIQVEASGIAKVNGWEFVATIEHCKPVNIIRSFRPEVTVPDMYYTVDTRCDHCNTKRNRKDTYLIRNTETGEFKQVGKSCLKDFTNGLDAEAVTRYISWFDELIKNEAPVQSGYTRYYPIKDVILYAVEAVNLYGYVKSDCEYTESTKDVVFDFLVGSTEWRKKHLDKGFNINREGNKEKAEAILDFVASLSNEFGYISNLKAACGKEYCKSRDIGIAVSAVACYNREMEYQQRKAKEYKVKENSNWVGEKGLRLTLVDADIKLLTSWENMYGITHLYQIIDKDGNVYTWKTAKGMDDGKVSLKGTVKAHSEFNGVKQTELTRCTLI